MKFITVLIIGFGWCISGKAQNNLPTVGIKTLAGKVVNFNKIVAGADTATVISFWATWCIPCITELDAINDQLAAKQSEVPFKFIAVSVDDTRTSAKVRSFVAGKGWRFAIYLDPNNDSKRALNVVDIPHLLIIKKGEIIYNHTGYISGNEVEWFEKLRTMDNE